MRSLKARAIAEEEMDAPDLPNATYAAVVHDLAQVNTVVMARRATLAFLKRAVGDRQSFSLLDVGFGDGDMLRAIANWSAKRGIGARLVGVDLNPKSVAAARERTPDAMAIDYRAGSHEDFAGAGFDLIVNSLVAHHMSHDQLLAYLSFVDREASRGWLINDLHRHRFAYTSFPILARIMRWHPIVRRDGTLSIARAYRPGEWPPILAEAGVEARVYRSFPFHLCVERLR